MIYLPSSGPPTQWDGQINRRSAQANQLVAWYSAQNRAVGMAEYIGRYAATVQNSPGRRFNPIIGSAVDLDGTNQRVNSEDIADITGPFSISVWAILDTLPSSGATRELVNKADSTGGYSLFFVNSGGTHQVGSVTLNGAGYTINTINYTLPTATPIHLTTTFDSANSRYYLNGQQIGTAQANTRNPAAVTKPLAIGAFGYYTPSAGDLVPNRWTDGAICDVRIWSRTLSAAEIWALYDPATRWELYQPARPLIWWIPFDDGSVSVSASDAVAVGESVSLAVSTAQIAKSESTTVGESVSLKPQTQIAKSDSATVGESVSLKPQTQIAKSDSTTVGESVSLKPQTQIAKSDSTTVGESVALSVIDSTRLVSVADAVSASEALAIQVGTAAVVAADGVTVGESVSVAASTAQIAVSDAATVGESVAVSVSTAQIAVGDSATVGEAASVRIVQSVALSVSAGSDDGFWNSGTFNNGAVYVSLGSGYSLFARWLLTIPQNSTIWHAHIDLYNVGYSFAGSLNTSIVAHDDDAPAAPTTDAEAASATRTTASAAWSVPVADQAAVGTTIQTADFATVIQELVDSYDYSSGSPAVVFIDHVSGSAIDLWLYSRDGSSTLAPKLHIGYTTTTQFITVADSVTVAEAIGLHVLSHVAVADSATVGESVSLAVANPQIAKSDSATVGEVVSLAVAAPQITAADSAAVSEAIGLHELSHVVTADASTVADAATLAISEPAIIVADASTVAESVAVIRELVDVRQFSTSDAVAAAESNAVTVSDPQIVVGDASTVADFATVAFNHQVTAADASIVAESHAVTVSDPQIVTADASTVADFATVAFNHEVATTDAVGVTDFSTVTISVLQITVTDGVTVTDVCAVEISALQITVADGVTVAETVTLHAIFFISVTDAASVAESYTLPPPLLSLTVSDAASVADSFTGYPAQLLLQSADAITVGDTIAMFVIVLHGLVDVTLTDSAAYNATLADSAAYRTTLADGALYSAVITDRTRTEGIG